MSADPEPSYEDLFLLTLLIISANKDEMVFQQTGTAVSLVRGQPRSIMKRLDFPYQRVLVWTVLVQKTVDRGYDHSHANTSGLEISKHGTGKRQNLKLSMNGQVMDLGFHFLVLSNPT